MTFDIELEKQNLDRFLSFAALKYEMYDVHWEFACEEKILDTYRRFMRSQITAKHKLSAARQAFWANIKFCENFRDYFDMHWDYFNDDAQYYAWRNYCVDELDITQTEDTEIWGIDNQGNNIILWEKPVYGCWLERSKKYKTWQDPNHGMIECYDLAF